MRFSAAVAMLQKVSQLGPSEPSALNARRALKFYASLFVLPMVIYALVKQVILPQQSWLGAAWAGDLRMLIEYGTALLAGGDTSPQGRNPYPPLATGFGALLSHAPFQTSVVLLSVLTVGACLIFGVIWSCAAAVHLSRDARKLAFFYSVTGFISYGFVFELERGQFNLLAMALALSSVLLLEDLRFSYKRLLAIGLAAVSIHLKAYPALLVGYFFLVQILRDVRRGDSATATSTVLLLAGLNVSLLFAFGMNTFDGFVRGIAHHFNDPQAWNGNHSLKSFLLGQGVSAQLSSVLKFFVLGSSLLALLVYLARATFASTSHLQAEPLLILFFLGEVLPTVSHDYKLSYMPLFMVLCGSAGTVLRGRWGHTQEYVLLSCYPLLCLPYSNLPSLFHNKFPLLAICVALPVSFALWGFCGAVWEFRIARPPNFEGRSSHRV